MPFSVTFLGTGTSQGIPIIGSTHPVCLSDNPKDKRLRVSVLLQWGTTTVVIDCGPDFRQQLLRENVQRIDAVLLTHEHSDHTAGIDDVRPFCFRQKMAIPFYATRSVFKSLEERFAYIFATENRYPGAPSIAQHVIDKNSSFKISDKTFTPVEALHYNLPVLGFTMEGFTYLTDVKYMDEAEILKIKNTPILVVNALRIEEHPSHFNLAEALAFIEKVAPGKAYLTHISHLLGFHDEVSKQLPENVFLAYDGLKITV